MNKVRVLTWHVSPLDEPVQMWVGWSPLHSVFFKMGKVNSFRWVRLVSPDDHVFGFQMQLKTYNSLLYTYLVHPNPIRQWRILHYRWQVGFVSGVAKLVEWNSSAAPACPVVSEQCRFVSGRPNRAWQSWLQFWSLRMHLDCRPDSRREPRGSPGSIVPDRRLWKRLHFENLTPYGMTIGPIRCYSQIRNLLQWAAGTT